MVEGNVAIILNAHFPYVRRTGRWPHGKDALAEVIVESYVPLLNMLFDVRRGREALPLTVSLSPVLLEQLADPHTNQFVGEWIAGWRTRAEADLRQFEAHHDGHSAYLARFYLDWIDGIAYCFGARCDGNLLAAIRRALHDDVALLLAPATYAYLPYLTPSSVRAQLKTGALPVLRHLQRRPEGLWLPGGRGCVDAALARELGLRYALAEPQRHSMRTDCHLPLLHPDRTLIEYVTAATVGYPGDGLYREFYRHHPDSGIAYWRVTSTDTPLEHKAPYDPYLAFSRADEHAKHFIQAIVQRLQTLVAQGQPPMIALAFDAELFGHWWFEGIHWLRRVLEHLDAIKGVRLVTAAQLDLPPSAMIEQGAHPIFDAVVVGSLRHRLDHAAHAFAAVVERYPAAEGLQEALLTQAARELLLAQSSDWAALIASGSAPDYAERRLNEHLERFERLLYLAEYEHASPESEQELAAIAAHDDLFAFLNYRVFA